VSTDSDSLKAENTVPDKHDRLSAGVERLAHETGELHAILSKVDEQQQRLASLTREVEQVQTLKASKDDVTDSATRIATNARSESRTQFLKVTIPVILGVALILFVIIFGLSNSAYQACERRQEATKTLVDVVVILKADAALDVNLDESIDRLRATLDRTCGDQYILKLPI